MNFFITRQLSTIRVMFEYGYEVGTYISVTRPILVFWIWGKPKPSQSKEHPSNQGSFVWVFACMSFVVMPRRNQSFYYIKSRLLCPPLWKYQWLNWILFCQRLNWTVKKLCVKWIFALFILYHFVSFSLFFSSNNATFSKVVRLASIHRLENGL